MNWIQEFGFTEPKVWAAAIIIFIISTYGVDWFMKKLHKWSMNGQQRLTQYPKKIIR